MTYFSHLHWCYCLGLGSSTHLSLVAPCDHYSIQELTQEIYLEDMTKLCPSSGEGELLLKAPVLVKNPFAFNVCEHLFPKAFSFCLSVW